MFGYTSTAHYWHVGDGDLILPVAGVGLIHELGVLDLEHPLEGDPSQRGCQ